MIPLGALKKNQAGSKKRLFCRRGGGWQGSTAPWRGAIYKSACICVKRARQRNSSISQKRKKASSCGPGQTWVIRVNFETSGAGRNQGW